MTDEYDFLAAWIVLLWKERAAEHRSHAQYREDVPGSGVTVQLLRVPIARQVEPAVGERGHVGENSVLFLPIDKVRRCRRVARESREAGVFPNHQQAVRIGE